MALVEDTRQQRGKHNLKEQYFEDSGECVVRCALPVGDYQRPAKVAVDTKKDIIELGTNVKAEHERFARECAKAQKLGTQLVILVENTDGVRCLADLTEWVESDDSYKNRNRSGKAVRYTGKSIAKACETMHKRYGVMFGFCSPTESGKRIIEILDKLGG
jgi:ribosome-associated protein